MRHISEVLIFTDFALQLFENCVPYSSKYSKKTYTNQQKIILLLIRQWFNLSYNQLIELMKISHVLLVKLSLNKIPEVSTLKKFAKTLKASFLNKYLGNSVNLFGCNEFEAAIDATGFSLQDGSVHYRKRLGLSSKTRKFLKMSSIVDTKHQLVISCEM